MSIAHDLKEIGRGQSGARSLDATLAADLMGRILDGQVSDLALGAFALAMRMKGGTLEEPAGFREAVQAGWRRHEPAFLPTEVLCPALQRLLDVRRVVGLRNSGHTVAKLLPVVSGAPVLRLASHTHPEFGSPMARLAVAQGLNLQLLRGTEGEPAADPRRCPRIDTWLGGQPQPGLGCPAQDGVLTELPELPREIDAATVARYIQAVLGGAQAAPQPLDRQAGLLIGAWRRLAAPATGAEEIRA